MKRFITKMTPGYLALMLGLGANPVVTFQNEEVGAERPLPSLAVQIEKTPTRLVGSWRLGQGMYWRNPVKNVKS